MALNKKRAENKTGKQHSTVKTISLSDAAPPCDFLVSRQLLRLYCKKYRRIDIYYLSLHIIYRYIR